MPSRSTSQPRRQPPPPAPVSAPVSVPKPSEPGLINNLLGNVVQGASWGVGSSLGHKAVDNLFNNNTTTTKNTNVTTWRDCDEELAKYQSCINQLPFDNHLKYSNDDCENIFDSFLRCYKKH